MMRRRAASVAFIVLLAVPLACADNNGGGTVTGFADAGGPYSGVVGTPVNFTASTTGGTHPFTFQWDYDYDGVTFDVDGIGQATQHTYDTAGHYIVAVNVTDATGNSSIGTATCDVTSGYNAPPVVDFSWRPLHPMAGEIVRFTDLSHDYDGIIVSWRWEFGDGFTSFRRNPEYRYDSPGSYTVTLTVTDDGGETSTSVNMIVIGNIPVDDHNYTLVVYTSMEKGALDGVRVTVDGQTAVTGIDGRARFTVPYGMVNVTASKKGYHEEHTMSFVSRDSLIIVEMRKTDDLWWLPFIIAIAGAFMLAGIFYQNTRR